MCSLWVLFLLLWFKWKDLKFRTENLPPYIFMGESMGAHYLNAFDNQKFNITLLVEQKNSIVI